MYHPQSCTTECVSVRALCHWECVCVSHVVCVSHISYVCQTSFLKVTCCFSSSESSRTKYEIEYTTWTAAEISSRGTRASTHRKLPFDYFVRTPILSVLVPLLHTFIILFKFCMDGGSSTLFLFFFFFKISYLDCKRHRWTIDISRHIMFK